MGILDTILGTGQGSGKPNDTSPYQPGMLGGLQAQFAPGMYAARQQGFNQQNTYQDLMNQPGMDPAKARAAATDPEHFSYKAGIQQQQLASVARGLQQSGMSPEQAQMYALNPDLLKEMAKPQVVAPGGRLDSGLPLGGPGGSSQGPPGTTTSPGGMSPLSQRSQNTSGMLDEASLTRMAEQGLLGEDVTKGAGMGALGQINKAELQKRISALAEQRGISPAELAGRASRFPAYAEATKNLTKIQTGMGTAGVEFTNLWPGFEQAAKQYGGLTNLPWTRQLEQAIREGTGDPNVVQLGQRINALANVYARAISTRAQGPTDSDKEHFREVLKKNWNPAQIATAGQTLASEIKAAHDSVPIEANKLKVQFGLADKTPPEMAAQAKDAIARGAPRDKVIEAIEAKGFKADGL